MNLRIGSLEMLGALAIFGVVAAKARFRPTEPPKPARPLAVELEVHDLPARGGRRVQQLVLRPGESALIGRSSDVQVGLLDPEVSRRHASLSAVDGVLFVTDLGSSNGTFLGGRRVGADGIEVLAGDALDVGTTRITVNSIEPA